MSKITNLVLNTIKSQIEEIVNGKFIDGPRTYIANRLGSIELVADIKGNIWAGSNVYANFLDIVLWGHKDFGPILIRADDPQYFEKLKEFIKV